MTVWKSEYRSVTRASGPDTLVIDDFPGVAFRAADFLPAEAEAGPTDADES